MSKKEEQIRLYYLGSGAIGIRVLEVLLASPCVDLIGCGTQPDRPVGRKRLMKETPISKWCNHHGIEVDKPSSVDQEDFLQKLSALNPNIILVFAFGQILRQPVLSLPQYGCMNIHTSRLPQYRGASPISAVILAGEKSTAISFMKMTEGLDSGPIYRQYSITIPNYINASGLETLLGICSASHVVDVLKDIFKNNLSLNPQNVDNVSYAPKVKKEDGKINWENDAAFIERQIRAYCPWPGAWFFLYNGKKRRKFTITQATVERESKMQTISSIICTDNQWRVVCGKDVLCLKKIIPEGKREMYVEDFLRGNSLETGNFLDKNETNYHK